MQKILEISNKGIKLHPSLRDFESPVYGRDIERLYLKTKKIVFSDKGEEIGDDEENKLERINAAYSLIKIHTQEEKRESGQRVFDHLKATAYNTLEISKNPSIIKVVASLLHDSIEDGHKSFESIKEDFGEDVAIIVLAITKKEINYYLSNEEKKEIVSSDILDKNGKLKEEIRDKKWNKQLTVEEKNAFKILDNGKNRRNKEYFGHMESFENMSKYIEKICAEKGIQLTKEKLEGLTISSFEVKFGDRIHNLETQWDPENLGKVERKIKETKKYFLEISKEINTIAYERMNKQIIKLEKQLVSKKLEHSVQRYKKKIEEINT